MRSPGPAPERGLERWAAGLSFLAAACHVIAFPGHATEWWAYGLFFSGSALAQAGYGLVLVTRGIEVGGGWPAVRRRVYWIGIVGNLAIVALWAATRTIGVPLGPERGEVEAVGGLDVLSGLAEVGLAALLGVLLRRGRPAAPRAARR